MDKAAQERLAGNGNNDIMKSSSSLLKKSAVPPHTLTMDLVQSIADKDTAIHAEQSVKHSIRNVVAVFVVRFDVHRGNIIEWQYPKEFDLDGVEYQAMCSGLHRVQSDLIYFSKSQYFGLSVFKNVATDGERGAVMKAVGVLVLPTLETGKCGEVWRHNDYLKTEASRQMEPSMENRYSSLMDYYQRHCFQEEMPFEYFHQKRAEPSSATSPLLSPSATTNTIFSALEGGPGDFGNINHHLASHVDASLTTETRSSGFLGKESSHLAHTFPDFVRQFGPNIFVLWKAMLLKKRVMFLTIPPMEQSCSFVYNTSLLGKLPSSLHSRLRDQARQSIDPLFCLGVNEIIDLEARGNYVACTPDAIFESKSDLYDVLVTLPAPSFTNVYPAGVSDSHSKKDTNKDFALSNLRICPEVKSNCQSIHPKYNTADFARFRILWRIFSAAQNAGVLPAEDNNPLDTRLSDMLAVEQKDMKSTIGAMMVGGWFWWYGRDTDRMSACGKSVLNGSTSQACTATSWQRIFAGATSTRHPRSRRKHRKRSVAPEQVPMDPEEQQALLLGSNDTPNLVAEEQDAIEIDNTDLLNVVAGHTSNESLPSADADDQNTTVSSTSEKLEILSFIIISHAINVGNYIIYERGRK
ncbi:hypothetical protein DFQ29_003177 [Apophysomyces sp. BC1021]|nr:hypothetical protein DFQ29_003177 [Apophysomyces sp. BC1021]